MMKKKMKSCIQWRKSFKYKEEIDQFNIDFKSNKDSQLINFLNIYAITQRVNIKIPSDITQSELDILIAVYETKKYKIAICCNWAIEREENKQITEQLKEKNIPFYFLSFAKTWTDLRKYVYYGVSDVFISGELTYDLTEVKTFCVKHNVQIRCFANIVQYEDYIQYLPDREKNIFKGFFIRPDDIDKYGKYIDIIEFYDSEDRQNTLYDIYFHMKKWVGNLQEIVKGFEYSINNHYLFSDLFNRKIDCNMKCYKNSKCDFCTQFYLLGKSLEQSDEYEVFYKRD